MIAIIDYGMGNLGSVEKAFTTLGYDAQVVNTPHEVMTATGVVLPGVGAFAEAMTNLVQTGLIDAVKATIRAGKPFLGICLGLQLLFTESEEGDSPVGLDILPGSIIRFRGAQKIPHIGWNEVHFAKNCPLFAGVADGSHFYFVHSYHLETPESDLVAGVTEYGVSFPSVVWQDNIFAVQFHPEKSSKTGLKLLANFGRLVERANISGN